MSAPAVRKVVVAGGGTAGWVAASALARQLGPLVEVVLVESDEIGTVGVGESTIPTTRAFHALLGIDEREFVCATRSSFKLGIAFEDWNQIGDRYLHAFGTTGRGTPVAEFQHIWLEARARGQGGDYGDYCLELQAAQAERFAAGQDGGLSYAYHLDASLYARFLRKRAEANGVTRLEGRIAEVRQDADSGYLTALVLQSGEEVGGDLFLDCTGFRALLIEGTLQTGFEDWSHWLSTDRAIAVQTRSTGPALPYTRAMAHSAGWQWRIPLQHRVGNGLVYDSRHMSDEEAMRLFRERLEGEPITEPRTIRFTAGRRRQAWAKNCVALGLAGGFVEPLESTSIHLIKSAVTRLIQAFPFTGINDALIARYNDQSRRELEGIRDFIILHYHLTSRDDSDFWRHCRTMPIPDTLAQRIALFGENGHAWQDADELFRLDSWVQVMLGQGLIPRGHHHFAKAMKPEQLTQALAGLRAQVEAGVARLPSHQAFLDRYCPPAAAV